MEYGTSKYYWIAVETDEYELPLFVADSARELAEKFDTTKHNVECSVDRGDNGRISGRKFMKISRSDADDADDPHDSIIDFKEKKQKVGMNERHRLHG